MSDAAALMDRMYRRQRHIYDLSRKFYLLGRDEAIAGLDAGPGDSVLEIGCGTGRNLVKLARAYPEARLFGLDVSCEMLASAAASVARAGLSARVALGQGDATAFDPEALLGCAQFDRVMISYALSMIPPWRKALARALDVVAPGGSLHLVDFGDCAGLPGPFRIGLRRWLAAFEVVPRDDLGHVLRALAAERGMTCTIETWFRGYASLAVARSQTSCGPCVSSFLSWSLISGGAAMLRQHPDPERAMTELHRITIDVAQCGGRPCLRGMRIRVKDVLDLLAAGASREEILTDYPLLEDGDIVAALEFAARQSDHPILRVA